ncbi:MAG: acyl-CoA synthetase FdrA [Kosmotoga sp.]|nr:MAG: acyl-CoA synthetase FdrA [Kosmotoga sp.]
MKKVKIIKGKYYDSVTLMLVAKELKKQTEINDATLNMATEANIHIMEDAGFVINQMNITPDDLLIGIDCEGTNCDEYFDIAEKYLKDQPWREDTEVNEYRPKSISGAISLLQNANLSLISISGKYAANEAMKSLENNLNVMLYSNNVPLNDEIKLKNYAKKRNLLVMGPDCGTALIKGKGLGFCNECPVGPIGIVAASGTGLQEVMVQLSRRNVGVKHAIGTGGRDVKSEVGAISFLSGLDALADDDDIKVIIALGKPPSPDIRKLIINKLKEINKLGVVCFMGDKPENDEERIKYTTELEECAEVTSKLLSGGDCTQSRKKLSKEIEDSINRYTSIHVKKGFLRGLFTGGTLCYEAQYIASKKLNGVHSNVPLNKKMKLKDSLNPVGHSFIDYGEDEFTQGRLHPMIDPAFRAEQIFKQSKDSEVAVILFDVMLGYGCASNPADDIIKSIKKAGTQTRPVYIAYICGTKDDPQKLIIQRNKLENEGIIVCKSNARAAHLASSLVSERGDGN